MEKSNKLKSACITIFNIICWVVIFSIVRTMTINDFIVPSGSMYPNLHVGDRIIVNMLSNGIRIPFMDKNIIQWGTLKRGDIVVFSGVDGRTLVKRVVGLPGDTVQIKDDALYINHIKVKQDALTDKNFPNDKNFPAKNDQTLNNEYFGNSKHQILTMSNDAIDKYKSLYHNNLKWRNSTVTARDNEVILIGDNRDNSYDSRFWGALPIDRIKGKVIYVLH